MVALPPAVTSKDGKPYVEVAVDARARKVFSPEEVSAMILAKMKDTAEVSRGTPMLLKRSLGAQDANTACHMIEKEDSVVNTVLKKNAAFGVFFFCILLWPIFVFFVSFFHTKKKHVLWYFARCNVLFGPKNCVPPQY